MPRCYFAHACNESEYVHFTHANRHLSAWRGRNDNQMNLLQFQDKYSLELKCFEFVG